MERMRTRLAALAVLTLGLVSTSAATAIDQQVPPSLVFARNGDLHRITLDGSETVRLTTTKVGEHSPAVSPDRLQVAFGRGDDELWVMDAQGGRQRRLLARRPPSVLYARTGSPSWSPGGRTLFLHRVSQTPNEICGSIFRVGAQGGGPKRVTPGVVKGSLDTDPAVSPDGRRIAISSGDCQPGFGADLAIIDTAGRTTRDLRKLGRTQGSRSSRPGRRTASGSRSSSTTPTGPRDPRCTSSIGTDRVSVESRRGRSTPVSPNGRPTARRSRSRRRTGCMSSVRTVEV